MASLFKSKPGSFLLSHFSSFCFIVKSIKELRLTFIPDTRFICFRIPPLKNLSLSAGKFQPDESKKSGRIDSFFKRMSNNKNEVSLQALPPNNPTLETSGLETENSDIEFDDIDEADEFTQGTCPLEVDSVFEKVDISNDGKERLEKVESKPSKGFFARKLEHKALEEGPTTSNDPTFKDVNLQEKRLEEGLFSGSGSSFKGPY